MNEMMNQFTTNKGSFEAIIDQLVELDEVGRSNFDQMFINQEKINETLDQKNYNGLFEKGYIILIWDKRKDKSIMHKKLGSLWLGP